MTRRFVTAFIAVFCSIPILAQHSEFPVYDDFSLPDPGKSTLLRKESLKPTDAFLDQYPDGIPAADNATLRKICNFYRNSSDGQKEWAGMASLTARVVSEWRLKGTGGFSAERYVIAVPFLKNIALVYIFTGEPLISLTNPEAAEAFVDQLKECQALYGIDGFKFDGGEAEYFRGKAKFYEGAAADYSHAYGEVCRFFPYHESRVGYRNGGSPIMVRLMDVPHDWEKLPDVLYNIQVSGLMGLPYTVGDMIGGGLVTHIPTDGSYSNKYMVRSCQLQALMPLMQFSMAPWRVLSKKECDICRDMANLHVLFSDYIMEQVRHASQTGEPIVRMMDYEFPGQGYDRKMPQFMLGPDYLVAPVLREDDRVTVELPAGKWLDDLGEEFVGPQVLHLQDVPLDRLPYYKRIAASLSALL